MDKHRIVQLSTGDMLRAAVEGRNSDRTQARDIMDRGELVPDDVVVGIVADRIEQPDARKGFILDGFPRTVPQANALDRMLQDKGLTLDAVIELKVDDGMLLDRIEKRAGETQARGEPVRADDNPETLKRRLLAYYAQTAPLAAHYARKGRLSSLDGMASIDRVARDDQADSDRERGSAETAGEKSRNAARKARARRVPRKGQTAGKKAAPRPRKRRKRPIK